MANPIVTGLMALSASITGTQTSILVGDNPTLVIAAKGGVAPYSYAISGQLPAGRTISGNTITGAFAGPGSFTYTVLVTDAVGNSVSIRQQPIVAIAGLNALTLSANTATIGLPFTATISGLTAGSILTAVASDNSAILISGNTIGATFAVAGSKTITLTETVLGAPNSPKSTVINITASAAVPSGKLLRQVASRGTTSIATGTATASTTRLETRHFGLKIANPCNRFKLGFIGYVPNTNAETNIGNSVAIQCAIENGTTVVQAKFNGVNQGVIPDGTLEYFSDWINASDFGLSVFPYNWTFHFRAQQDVAVGQKYINVAGAGGSDLCVQSDGTGASQLLGTGNMTGAGAGPNFRPSMIIGEIDPNKVAVYVSGMSITAGQGGVSATNGGYIGVSMGEQTNYPTAYINTAVPGTSVSQIVASFFDKRRTLMKYCSYGYLDGDTNGLASGVDGPTSISQCKVIWGQMKAAGMTHVEQGHVIPRVSGTYADDAGQTPITGFAIGGAMRDAFNTGVINNVGKDGLDAYVAFPNIVSATAADKWVANMTGDGIHPVNAGHALMAQSFRIRVLAWAAKAGQPVPPLVLSTVSKLAQFSDNTNWTGSGYTGTATVGSKGLGGAPSLRLAENGGSGAINVTKTGVVASTVDPATLGTIAYFSSSDTPYWERNSAAVAFVRGGTTYASPTENTVLQSAKPGLWQARHISEFANAGTALNTLGSGTALDARITIGSAVPHNSTIDLDRLYANAQGRPTLVLTWDDGISGQYTNLLPLLQKYSINGSFAPIKNRAGQSGYMTIAQIQALYDAGNDIICDGRDDDNSPVTATSLSDAMANINSVRDWTNSNGWTRGANHIVWPFGVFETSARNNFAINVTSGSPVVTMSGTGANVTTNIVAGMSVGAFSGLFPSGTTVVSVDSISQLTLSQNALLTNSSATYGIRVQFTDDVNAPFFGSKLIDACKAAGFLTGRTVGAPNPASGNQMFTRFGMAGQEICYPSYSFTSTSVASDLTSAIDLAILRGTTMANFSHDVQPGTTSGNTVSTSTWDTVLAYAAAKRDAGLLDILTVSQWHARDLATPAIPTV